MGVYFTERVEEFESDVALRRRVAIGILDAGDLRWGDRTVACSEGCTGGPSPVNVDVAALVDRSWKEELKEVVGKCGPSPERSREVFLLCKDAGVASSASVLSNAGIPNPGDMTSPLTTSPKKGCRPLEAGLRLGDATLLRVGETWWSILLLLPFVRRALRGAAGAGCGLSRGFRLLNL